MSPSMGGETWMLTGGNDKLPGLHHAPPPNANPEWRVAAGNVGKAIEVETRADGKWTDVASFLIQVASCGK